MPGPLDAGLSAREVYEMRKDNPDEGCFKFISNLAITVTICGISFIGVRWLFIKIPTYLDKALLSNAAFDIILSCIVLVAGYAFYHLREKRRLIYAAVELGAASATAFVNFPQLIDKPFQAVLAIMGAIYITVRAFDNFYKWKNEKSKIVNNLER